MVNMDNAQLSKVRSFTIKYTVRVPYYNYGPHK